MKFLVLLLLGMNTAWAQVPPLHPGIEYQTHEPTDLIEVGAGGVQLGEEQPLDILIQVKLRKYLLMSQSERWDTYFILARVSGEMGTDGNYMTQLDFRFETLGVEWVSSGWRWGISTFGFEYAKDFALDNYATAQVRVIGVSAGYQQKIGEHVKILAQVSADLFAKNMSERWSDGARAEGPGDALGAELGITVADRFRLVASHRVKAVGGSPEKHTYYDCWREWDEYFEEYYEACGDRTGTRHLDQRRLKRSEIRLAADLTKSLSLFGSAGVHVYSVKHRDDVIDPSDNRQWQFRFGVSYRR